jgi:hypothetical protein
MHRHKFLVLMVCVFALDIGQAHAQKNATAEAQTSLAANAKPVKDCKNNPKMRCTTNDMRWAAAIRNADRHADQLRKKGKVKK